MAAKTNMADLTFYNSKKYLYPSSFHQHFVLRCFLEKLSSYYGLNVPTIDQNRGSARLSQGYMRSIPNSAYNSKDVTPKERMQGTYCKRVYINFEIGTVLYDYSNN